MDLYKHEELDAIAAAPKRRDVVKLVDEVKRLSVIARAADQLVNTRNPATREALEQGLRQALATAKSQWPLFNGTARQNVDGEN